MQREFGWLIRMVLENQEVRWKTAYRDFVDSELMLRATSVLGIVRKGNNGFSEGEFYTSTGHCYRLTLDSFVETLGLVHSPTTWRNKLTTHSRILDLQSYVEHRGGLGFQLEEHRTVWDIVGRWVENKDKVLPVEDWTTRKYGNTRLAKLIAEMVREANNGERTKFSQSGCLVY